MDQFERDADVVEAQLEVCEYEMDEAVVQELNAFEESNQSKSARAD